MMNGGYIWGHPVFAASDSLLVVFSVLFVYPPETPILLITWSSFRFYVKMWHAICGCNPTPELVPPAGIFS